MAEGRKTQAYSPVEKEKMRDGGKEKESERKRKSSSVDPKKEQRKKTPPSPYLPGSALNHSSTISRASSILLEDSAAGGDAGPV